MPRPSAQPHWPLRHVTTFASFLESARRRVLKGGDVTGVPRVPRGGGARDVARARRMGTERRRGRGGAERWARSGLTGPRPSRRPPRDPLWGRARPPGRAAGKVLTRRVSAGRGVGGRAPGSPKAVSTPLSPGLPQVPQTRFRPELGVLLQQGPSLEPNQLVVQGTWGGAAPPHPLELQTARLCSVGVAALVGPGPSPPRLTLPSSRATLVLVNPHPGS